MARGITEADVLEAADALLARGERPTIERVRQELGRGSPNTVNRHLDVWWTSLAQRVQGQSGSTLPASLLELCGRLYAGVRHEAQAEAMTILDLGENRLKASMADLEAERNALQLERVGATAASERLAAELSALRDRNEALTDEKFRLQSEIERVASTASQAMASAKSVGAALELAQAKHQAEVQRIRAQWEGNEKRWLDEIVHMREDAKRARTEHASAMKSLQAQLKEAQSSVTNAHKHRLEREAELARAEAALMKEREARITAEAAARATSVAVKALEARLGAPKAPRRSRGNARPSRANVT